MSACHREVSADRRVPDVSTSGRKKAGTYHGTPDLRALAGINVVARDEEDLRARIDAVDGGRGRVRSTREQTSVDKCDGWVLVVGVGRECLPNMDAVVRPPVVET